MVWYLYILRCGDGTLYTGITDDLDRRLATHRAGKGAKYTRGRGPLELIYREECGTHSQALKRELEIKAMPREKKLKGLKEALAEQERQPEPRRDLCSALIRL